MKLTSSSYVPSLRIRAAELQALRQLVPNLKSRVRPLFTLPPIEFNFETREDKTDIDTHVERRIKTIKNNWAEQLCWIDVHQSIRSIRLKNDKSIISHLVHSLTSENLFGTSEVFIPVLMINDGKAIARDVFQIASSKNNTGFGLRLLLDDLSSPGLKTSVNTMIDQSGLSADCIDLILDLEAPASFIPLQIFANAIIARLKELVCDLKFRNIVLISTAIPNNYTTQGPQISLYPRYDWQLYLKFLEEKANREWIYGDYTIVHPRWNADRDMRQTNAPAKVIYAIKNQWLTRKGTSFRSDRSQMHTLCSEIVNSGYFMSKSFSEGSRYIYECAQYREQPSNLTCWKRVGINHHINVVLNDLSTLHESS